MTSDPGQLCIDFHTHGIKVCPRTELRIVSSARTELSTAVRDWDFRTLELHPWHGEPFDETFARMAEAPEFIGIGEVGLDRNRGKLALNEQQKIFRQCVNLAETLQKPLTVHCVGCFSELLEEYKRHPWQVPTILHYFCGSPALARQLLRHENFFLSLPPLAMRSDALLAWIRETPEAYGKIVLETDDPDGDITEHYQQMAPLLGRNFSTLVHDMQKRFQTIYPSVGERLFS